MDKKFIAILLVLVIGFMGFFVFTKKEDAEESSSVSATTSQHSQGAGTAKVELVEYGDFECPACGGYYPLLKEVKQKYGDQITFTFKHFPIDSIHPNARAAHRAAEAASNQGKFFEMHDLLYENQTSWRGSNNAKSVFDSYAVQLGLDIDKYNADFASETTNGIINADSNEGKAKGVNSTPTFFLNGKQVANDEIRTVEQLSKLIDDQIALSAAPQNSAE
jgi:protein-disulfide isomerase